jgi:hypothetical protein
MAFDAMKVLETTDFSPPNHIAFLSLMRAVNRLGTNRKSQTSDVRISTMRWWTRSPTGHCRSASVGLESLIQKLHPDWIRNVPPRDRPLLQTNNVMLSTIVLVILVRNQTRAIDLSYNRTITMVELWYLPLVLDNLAFDRGDPRVQTIDRSRVANIGKHVLHSSGPLHPIDSYETGVLQSLILSTTRRLFNGMRHCDCPVPLLNRFSCIDTLSRYCCRAKLKFRLPKN